MSKLLLILVSLFLTQVTISVESQRSEPTYVAFECGSISNNGSTVASLAERKSNLTDILYHITLGDPGSRYFYNLTAGDDPNKVYILFQCRPDLRECSPCHNLARERILSVCDLTDEAVVWYEECMFRYAYRNIFSLNETDPWTADWSNELYSNYSRFAPKLEKAMDDLITMAATGSNGDYFAKHFAKTETKLTSSQKWYGLAQCTPDLDNSQCQSCLETAFSYMLEDGCCATHMSATVFLPSCQLKYSNKSLLVEGNSFEVYSQAPSPSLLPPGDQNNQDFPVTDNKRPMKRAMISGIASAAAVGFLLLVVVAWLCLRPKKPQESLPEHMPEATDGS